MKYIVLAFLILLISCTTSFIEFKGECVIQEWRLVGYAIRVRQICDLPPPEGDEKEVRDREAMGINPFPDLFERNKADSTDPNLLEKTMGYPQEEK